MKVEFKIPACLVDGIRTDLARPHAYAAERVGFIHGGVAPIRDGIIVLGEGYQPVEDEDYLDDPSVGAMMGAGAIRNALQFAYQNRVSMFHIHMHEHSGRPWFSRVDLHENAQFVPDFLNVRPEFPHGALVLSLDSVSGLCWVPHQEKPIRISKFSIVGAPLRSIRL
jgi:hypothetical protein